MQIVNLNNPTIKAFSRGGKKVVQMRVSERQIAFTRPFCVSNKIVAGQYVHFINDGADWKFYINQDKDGFQLISDRHRRGGLILCNIALCHMLRKSTGMLSPASFPIEPTKMHQNGKQVFMIMTHKPIK